MVQNIVLISEVSNLLNTFFVKSNTNFSKSTDYYTYHIILFYTIFVQRGDSTQQQTEK